LWLRIGVERMLSLAIQSKRALFHVRRLAAYVAIVVAAAALTGCNGVNQGFLRNGIGADLPARDIGSATELQRIYFNYLCKQAGLIESSYGDEAPDCILPPENAGIWTLIVKQGMNDIDRRCDAYLEWLDDRKRSRAPLLSQISTVRTATEAIIGLTGSSSSTAISVVAIAFQLLSKSVENYHSRLLLEVDTSTINSIVLGARHRFRADFQNVRIQNRPDAEHVLRSYLRLCLPFAIETNINSFSTLASLGINPNAEGNSINQTPMVGQVIGSANGGTERQFSAREKLIFDAIIDEAKAIKGAETAWEKQLQTPDLKKIQEYLCIAKPAANFGSRTRVGIRLWTGLREGSQFERRNLDSREGALLITESTKDDSDCDTDRYKNIFERLTYATPKSEAEFVKKLAAALGKPDPFSGEGTLTKARSLIKEYLEKNSEEIFEGLDADEVTPDMSKVLL